MGTGIERMKDAARKAEVAEPEFVLTDFFKTTFRRNESETPIDRQSVANRSQSMPNGIDNGIDDGIESGADKKSTRILNTIVTDPKITQSKLAAETGLSVRTVARELKILRDAGIIKRVGSDRAGYWEIIS